MPSMLISGRREHIPPFPHHKAFIHRAAQYFFAASPAVHLYQGDFATFRETARSLGNRCFIPRALLLDPTTACNLRCKGCWAADYRPGTELSFEKLDDILSQAEALGIEECLMTGGEPLLRKADILRLAARHRRTHFGLFTNGLLVDEAFVGEMARLENLNVFLSIEGWREQTDDRRGDGVFDRVVRAMDLLRSRGIAFGFSACYTAANVDVVTSDAFLDFLREKGAWFGWLFQYLPIGSGADPTLVCPPDKRAMAMERFSAYSRRHGMPLIDFWNLGHLIFGCIGAGTGFVHINAAGDVEPCAFCHYSDANLHETTLKEALQSPFFRRFRAAQPFNGNPLRCCPLQSATDTLDRIVRETGARSTHNGVAESPAELGKKTHPVDEAWMPVADRIHQGFPDRVKRNVKTYRAYLAWKKRRIDGPR